LIGEFLKINILTSKIFVLLKNFKIIYINIFIIVLKYFLKPK